MQKGIEFKTHIEYKDNDNIFKGLPVGFLKSNLLAPFNSDKGVISIAITDVLKIQPLDDLKLLFKNYTFKIVVTTISEVQKIINTHFELAESATTNEIIENLEESDFEILSRTSSETVGASAVFTPLIVL